MVRFLLHASTFSLGLTVLCFACRGQGAPSAPSQPPATSPSRTSPSVPTVPALDLDGPSLDLFASRALWHLERTGLVLPFTSEGFRKYSQEYRNPWRGLAQLEDHLGRTLGTTAASLRLPWDRPPGTAHIVVRLHGGSAGRKLSLRLNGRPLGNAKLEPGWQQVVMPVPEGVLVHGENTLAVGTGKKGALFHSIELAPGEPGTDAAQAWPMPMPVVSGKIGDRLREGLGGFARLWMPVEIPQDGFLTIDTAVLAGTARIRVVVTPVGEPAQVLLDENQPAGSVRPRRLPLAAFAGKLVRLELGVSEGRPSDVAWLAPRILLARTSPRPRPEPARNAILLVADALRADKLPMYAESRVRVPNIAKAAAESGVTFTSTQAASPSSPPSHASIQSGCLPRTHGVLGDKSKVTPNTPTVSAILAKAGLATVFVGDASFAMNRLKPVSTWSEFHMPSKEGKGGDCHAVIKQILDFADQQAGKRFFAAAVAFEPHTPYFYHPGTTEHYYEGPFDDDIGKRPDGVQLTAIVRGKLKMTPARWAQLKGLYDGEVEHLDGCVGEMLDGLKSRGLAENTPVFIVADHGEGFFEHGSMGHAYGQYAELTNVPLLLLASGWGHGQKIATVVSHTDVVPTILDILGVAADPRLQGESLLPMILRDGPWVPRVQPSEYGRSYSLRSRQLHYSVDYSGKESIYDIAKDPGEKTDIKEASPLALRYFRDLTGFYLAHRAEWHTPTWGTLNNHRVGFAGGKSE